MPRAIDWIAWVFPFFGVALTLKGGHVLFITAGSVTGCAFERIAGDIHARLDQDRKVREIDRQLIARIREHERANES
jgi:hypothetical protein